MSQLSDYQRCVERPQNAAYEARIAQLERDLAEARAELALQSEAREVALTRAVELSVERDNANEELGKVIMACPQGMRRSPASEGVKLLRTERDRLAAEVERLQLLLAAPELVRRRRASLQTGEKGE